MPDLSPGLNTRFANIELEKSASAPSPAQPGHVSRSGRKQYPANLYPQSYSHLSITTPSQAPRLSTAARAESRSISSSKPHVLPQASPNRSSQSAQTKDHTTQDIKLHNDKTRKYPEPPLSSFMKDTTSSRKKQATCALGHRPLVETRSASHPDIYSRRIHHSAVAPIKKRTITKPPQSIQGLDTNLESSVNVHVANKATVRHNFLQTRHASADHTPRSKEDVYTRLYQDARKPKQTAHRPSGPNFPSLERSQHTRHSSPSKSTSGSPPAPIPSEKPSTVNEMYKLIYKADPLFFPESDSYDTSLVEQDPISATGLLNSEEGKHLSVYERGEIMRQSKLYFVPKVRNEHETDVEINVSNFKNNYGFDDGEGNYVIRPKDQIEYRYEIVRVLGTGSFGNVVHCKDHKFSGSRGRRNVAIKLIKNELDWSLQAVSEIKMLKHLMAARNGKDSQYIMNFCDHFHFRGHMCIVSEILSLNFYTFLELGNFKGVSLSLVKNFALKIMKGIQFIHEHKVIHCDIKPENIMIRLPPNFHPEASSFDGFDVKLIDFGSSCFESETSFSYIQSRFYRAPEIILGAKYSYEIDIWSFGCVIAEIFTGCPLFPGKNELEQVALILEMFGAPPSTLIIQQRKRLLRHVKLDAHRKLNDPLVSDVSVYSSKSSVHVDDKKLKKTLLYTLFNLEGKVNLAFLNSQIQAFESKDQSSPGPIKRSIKINVKSLDVTLRLHNSNEAKCNQASFSKFMESIFQWDPAQRPTASQLLQSSFLQEIS